MGLNGGVNLSEHIHCGGQLHYDHLALIIVTDKHDNYIKEFYKEFWLCDKCEEYIHIIRWASYDELVLNGALRVSKEKYWRIKNYYDSKKEVKNE
jgi:hypothetical protein